MDRQTITGLGLETTGVSDFRPGTLTQGYSRNVFKSQGPGPDQSGGP